MPLTNHMPVTNSLTGKARLPETGLIIATESENRSPRTADAIKITAEAGPQNVQLPNPLPMPVESQKYNQFSVEMKACKKRISASRLRKIFSTRPDGRQATNVAS